MEREKTRTHIAAEDGGGGERIKVLSHRAWYGFSRRHEPRAFGKQAASWTVSTGQVPLPGVRAVVGTSGMPNASSHLEQFLWKSTGNGAG